MDNVLRTVRRKGFFVCFLFFINGKRQNKCELVSKFVGIVIITTFIQKKCFNLLVKLLPQCFYTAHWNTKPFAERPQQILAYCISAGELSNYDDLLSAFRIFWFINFFSSSFFRESHVNKQVNLFSYCTERLKTWILLFMIFNFILLLKW